MFKNFIGKWGFLIAGIIFLIAAIMPFAEGQTVKVSFFVIGIAFLAIVACAGTAMLQPWSRYLVYLLTTGFTLAWSWSVASAARAGYFSFAFRARTEIFRSLLPELVLVALSAACSYMVFRYFRLRQGPVVTDPTQLT